MVVQKHQDTHPLTVEHYRRHRQRLADKGTAKKPHAISTKDNIKGIKKRWKKYCELMNEDLLAFLQYCIKEDIMTFLNWILDYHYVRKKSTLHEYWRVWRMLYRRCVGRRLYTKIATDINDYIDEDLRRAYNLDLTVREKSVMNVDDVSLILDHHWVMDTATFPDGRQRLQVPFLQYDIQGLYKSSNQKLSFESRSGWSAYPINCRKSQRLGQSNGQGSVERKFADIRKLQLCDLSDVCHGHWSRLCATACQSAG